MGDLISRATEYANDMLARRQEREAIVGMLRKLAAAQNARGHQAHQIHADALDDAANRIERGDHLTPEGE